jgi:hypothetical protein
MTFPEMIKEKAIKFPKRGEERRGEERRGRGRGREGKGEWKEMEIAICTDIPIIPTTVRTESVEIIFAWEREWER